MVLHTPCALGEADLLPRHSPQEMGSLQSSSSVPHLWQEKPPWVPLIHPRLFQKAPVSQGGLFWASEVATSRTFPIGVCRGEPRHSSTLGAPGLNSRTGLSAVPQGGPAGAGRHTELPAVAPGAVHTGHNSNKSQRQARPTGARALGMHPCRPATATATLTSAAAGLSEGSAPHCCPPNPLQTAPASTHASKELAVHRFPLSCLLFATAPLPPAGRQENTFLQLSHPPQQTLNQ